MTRIGFAYNQKPEPESADAAAELSRADEEPPSSVDGAHAAVAALVAPAPDDEFAEWDSAETIDAVARALARHGEVIRLEARDDFPERLRAERPDIVFNIAEGLRGPNREAHVPAICEFYGVPYSGSDPFTLALCLDKARTKEILRANDVPTADWVLVRSAAEIDAALARRWSFPLFAKPVHEGSSKGITERNLAADADALRAIVADLLERYQQPVLVEHFLAG
jgi:D-alanine-D-alanine ligase